MNCARPSFTGDIELNNKKKQIRLREAVYMDQLIWDINIDGKRHLIQKKDGAWYQSPERGLDEDEMQVIVNTIREIEKEGYKDRGTAAPEMFSNTQ